MFVIQSGIALPPKSRVGGSSKFPLDQLQVDQSFFIPNATKATGVSLSKRAKSLSISITTRKVKEHAEYDTDGNPVGDKVDGLRVWRVAPPAAPAAA